MENKGLATSDEITQWTDQLGKIVDLPHVETKEKLIDLRAYLTNFKEAKSRVSGQISDYNAHEMDIDMSMLTVQTKKMEDEESCDMDTKSQQI